MFYSKGTKTKFVKGWERPTVVHELPIHHKKNKELNELSKKIKAREIDPGEKSHGTAMVANIYATAPNITLIVYSNAKGVLLFDQIEKAMSECDIISFSGHLDFARESKLWQEKYTQLFLNTKKIIIYCIGNVGRMPFPVLRARKNMIVVGGVYQHKNTSLQASNYATATKDFLPDICGLCGVIGKENSPEGYPNQNYPDAAYIWLPADPVNDPLIVHNDEILKSGKVKFRKGEFSIVQRSTVDSNGKRTFFDQIVLKNNSIVNSFFHRSGTEGRALYPSSWQLASGTSSATPQIAGVVALMLQNRRDKGYRDLTIQEIRAILRSTAREVTEGKSYYDEATLEGGIKATEGQKKWCLLVDAEAAVEKAVSERKEFVDETDNHLIGIL